MGRAGFVADAERRDAADKGRGGKSDRISSSVWELAYDSGLPGTGLSIRWERFPASGVARADESLIEGVLILGPSASL